MEQLMKEGNLPQPPPKEGAFRVRGASSPPSQGGFRWVPQSITAPSAGDWCNIARSTLLPISSKLLF